MSLSVVERARAIATFRFVEVRLMELAAAWTPTTPEMEVKVVLGRHIWDFAQHADALGKRTFELRHPAHHTLPPVEAYRSLLEDAAGLTATAERLAALYDVLVPGLARRYSGYHEEADPVLDAPSRVIIERILQDLGRQRSEADGVRRELGLLPADATALRLREESVRSLED